MYYNQNEDHHDNNDIGNGNTQSMFDSASSNQLTHNELQHPMDTTFSYFNLDDASFLSNSMPSSEFMTEAWKDLYSDTNQSLADTTLFSPMLTQPPQADNNNVFLQEDILLSDPSFLRSQVLHNQQTEMFERIEQQQLPQPNAHDDDTPYTIATSNSFLLGQVGTSNDISSDHGTIATLEPQQPRSPPCPHQPQPSSSAGKRIRRSFVGRSSRPNPIPIAGNRGGALRQPSSMPIEVDHQRRLSELQARFRINYARKPSNSKSASGTTSSNHTNEAGTGVPIVGSVERNSSVSGSSTKPQAGLELKTSQLTEKLSSSMGGPSRRASASSNNNILTSRTLPIQIQRVHRPSVSQVFDAEQHQRRLDDQLVQADFDDITVTELKEILRQRGKPATGKKAVLLQRLQDERALVNAARRGHRFSQPPPVSSNDPNATDVFHPRSFQNTLSTSIPHSLSSPLVGSPRSLQIPSSYLPSSPGSASLNRSIANMHIGSPPPAQQSAHRFSPYAPGSPRLESLSPQQHDYSASMPASYFSSSPNSYIGLSTSLSTNARPAGVAGLSNAAFNAGARSQSYAPFTPSSLATPDHEIDCDPFEDYTHNPNKHPPIDIKPNADTKMEGMDWLDPSIEHLFQQASVGTLSELDLAQDLQPRVTNDHHDIIPESWAK